MVASSKVLVLVVPHWTMIFSPNGEILTKKEKNSIKKEKPSPLKEKPSPLKEKPSPLKEKPSPLKEKPSPISFFVLAQLTLSTRGVVSLPLSSC